jgi:organic radical activating enzyme
VDEGFLMAKSDYLNDAEQVKSKLDLISPSLCLAKWQQTSLHLTTGMTNSCYHPPLHKIDASAILKQPNRLHNTDEKYQQRAEMLAGQRPPGCSYCWTMEDQGNMSDRHYRSGEPWASKHFDKIAVSNPNTPVNPSYVEVNFSNICNFRCSYCSPQFSSAWAEDADRHGAWPTSNRHNDPVYFQGDRKPIHHRDHNPYVEAFWSWWPELYPTLEHFRMTGGEPILDHNTYRVLDYVKQNPKKDLHLATTSNFCPGNENLWNKYLASVKEICDADSLEHFMQFVSLDAWGHRAEYIRNGLQFEELEKHVHEFLEHVDRRSSLTFIITYNNLSVTSIKDLLEWILSLRKKYSKTYQRVWFDIPVLRQPSWQNINILPRPYQYMHQKAMEFVQSNLETEQTPYHGFKDFELSKLARNLDYMKQTPVDADILKADFYKFFNEHDRRRNTNFLTTFPEMAQFWKECEYHAQTN